MMSFLSHPLRFFLPLSCILVVLPRRNAFSPEQRCHVLQHWISSRNQVTPSVTRPCSSVVVDVSKIQSGFKRHLDLRQRHVSLFMSTSPNDNEKSIKDTETTTPTSVVTTPSLKDLSPTERILATEKMDPTTRAVVEAAQKRLQSSDDEAVEQKYPIDLPSPLLLSTSMILAIASAGCLFELLGGSRDTMVVGFAPTLAIAVLGTPLSIFLLYAAITKATAETEADDQAFLSGK